jgi:hypothetical protein
MKTIQKLLEEFERNEEARTLKQIETALESFNISECLSSLSESQPDPENTTAEKATANTSEIPLNKANFGLIVKFQGMLDSIIKEDESKSLELNAKTRRKVKRLQDIVSGVVQFNREKYPLPAAKASKTPNKTNTNEDDEDNDGVDYSHLLEDKNLVELIEKVKESSTAVDLETNLTAIKSGEIGNTHSRRKLKRTIEQVLTKEEIDGGMNAKIRRRVNRVIKTLTPGETNLTHLNNSKNDNNLETNKDDTNNDNEQKKKKKKKESDNPFVVFVGQLPYTCKEDDLLQYFQETHQIQGPIKIRFLTNPNTKEFKGMAFAEFMNYEEMKKALLLHHSIFQSRKINVERSNQVGKKNAQREEILKQNKERQQSEINSHFQQIFQHCENKGILSAATLGKEFKEKLMKYSPIYLEKVTSR